MAVQSTTEARDEVLGHIKDAWDAGGASAGLVLGYEGVEADRPQAPEAGQPANPKAWGWISFHHVDGRKASFGPNGRHRRVGLVMVEIYGPSTDGLTTCDALATIVEDALEGARTSNGVVFRQVRPQEVGLDGPWFHVNVLAEAVYDKV